MVHVTSFHFHQSSSNTRLRGTTVVKSVVMSLAFAIGGCTAHGDEGRETTEDLASAESSDQAWVGTYVGSGDSLDNVVITNWGGSPLLTGNHHYGANTFRVEYVLKNAGFYHYEGSSSIEVDFENGARCVYPV